MLQKKLSNTSNSTPNGETKKTESALKVIGIGGLQALLIVFVTGALLFWWRDDKVKVLIGTASIQADVADTVAEREQGLSDKTYLSPDHGMLFVFPHDARWRMWMKDMRIPIDIVWLDASKKVVSVQAAADPASYPTYFTPPQDARYVLEIANGQATRGNIELGIRAQFDVPAATK